MELVGLLEAMRLKPSIQDGTIEIKEGNTKIHCEDFCQRRKDELASNNSDGSRVFSLLQQRRINIPHNLSILATINTSDESIYYLDSAFKRRWDWEYVKAPVKDASIPKELQDVKLIIDGEEKGAWSQ